ncbi:hypothetical protein FJV41_10235 [Myxococcus llanfairpwllgwyngyllgogerychwyrndrobwllllantysiliogogogochensis]|uniref:Uncharacterized protein n=2 Tax=Myxococcus llanfairpwllgwyngyllgogerychwyrndrobwllllantysiliogogogochensis TaxID=2590453 RepID=A0A540X5P0_9BACT|nr:hypothetical protein FJV41_10235 [Myxococcus llanfairpwllgwyngyllgogerychwyrndrobwllllantysiliogogogochensis]
MNPSEPPWWRRRLTFMLGLGIAALVAGGLLSLEPPTPPDATPVAAADHRPPPTPTSTAPVLPTKVEPVVRPAPKPAPAPIIDSVTVEKQEVCSGEDNLINVRAHSPDGNDAYLHTTIGAGIGMRVPLRVWREPDGTYELPTVTVFGKDNVATTVQVPRYTVKDCEPERLVEVFSRRAPNTEEDFEFLARILEPPRRDKAARAPFTPVRFVWTFDDQHTVTTSTPMVTQTLSPDVTRPRSMYVQHLVRVDVFDATGKKVTGRSSLQLLDSTFENFDKKGVVTILAVGTPRFPVEDADGVVRQSFRLSHRWKGPVRLERVTALRARTPEPDAPPLPEDTEEVNLGVDTLPEGRGVDIPASLDTRSESGVTQVTYLLEGTTADGHPARGTFSVMRPPPRPTRENSTPVTDPLLLAKVKRARELLGQPFVTDEDLWRLEREGRFKDLKVQRDTP